MQRNKVALFIWAAPVIFLCIMGQINRDLQQAMYDRLQAQKVLLLFGARRVGKTVLVKQLMESFDGTKQMLNGESMEIVRLLEDRSITNYQRLFAGIDLLVIDEAQHIPDIGMKLKLIADELPNLRVIATGSSAFDLKNQAGEPLVGRSTSFYLSPLSLHELSAAETMFDTLGLMDERLVYGTYPELLHIPTYEQKEEYLADLTDAYLLRDILALDGIKNASKMHDLLRLIAYQVGQEVSYDEIAKQIGVSRNTVERYLDLLQKCFVIYKLGAFSRNLRKEISKGSKWYFVDNGVRNAVLGDFKPFALRSDAERGALWENFVVGEIRKRNLNMKRRANLYFWRTYDKQEIDLIEEYNGMLHAYEIKAGKKNPVAPLAFRNAYPDAAFAVINRENFTEVLL